LTPVAMGEEAKTECWSFIILRCVIPVVLVQ